MAPKNYMKFKPKTDTRATVKEEPEDETVSAFQRERLRQVEAVQEQKAIKEEKDKRDAAAEAQSKDKPIKQRKEATSIATFQGNQETKLEALPDNSIHQIMADDGDEGSFRPMMLSKREKMEGQDNAEDMKEDSKAEVKAAIEEGNMNAKDGTNADVGTAFLHRNEEEKASCNRANLNFFTNRQEDGLVWFQLPNAVAEHQGNMGLKNTPPGKIGQLVVYKSGKTVLRINGVDHLVSCEEDAAKNISQNAVALLPSPDGGMSNPCCYDLGPISKKAICSPAADVQ